MMILAAPVGRLADHVVRPGCHRQTLAASQQWTTPFKKEQLDGGWLADVPFVTG